MIIAVDFDGTCVTHAYPEIGEDIGAVHILKSLVDNKHELILYTMRSDKYLDEAVNWFKGHDISLYGININPTQKNWTNSNKCYAQLYIDDAALGIPLMRNVDLSSREFVDWYEVSALLRQKGLI